MGERARVRINIRDQILKECAEREKDYIEQIDQLERRLAKSGYESNSRLVSSNNNHEMGSSLASFGVQPASRGQEEQSQKSWRRHNIKRSENQDDKVREDTIKAEVQIGEIEQMKNDYNLLIEEYCNMKIEKAHTEHELLAVVNCVEALTSPKQTSHAAISNFVSSISEKNLMKINSFLKEKNYRHLI